MKVIEGFASFALIYLSLVPLHIEVALSLPLPAQEHLPKQQLSLQYLFFVFYVDWLFQSS